MQKSRLFIPAVWMFVVLLPIFSKATSEELKTRGPNVINRKNQTTSITVLIPHYREYTENKDDYRLIREEHFWLNLVEHIEKVIGEEDEVSWFSLTSLAYRKSIKNSKDYFSQTVVADRKENSYYYREHAVVNEDTVKVVVASKRSGKEFPLTFIMEKGFWKIEQDVTMPETGDEYPEDTSKLDPRILFKIEDIVEEEDLEKHIKGLFDNIEEKIMLGDFEGYWYSLSMVKRKELKDPATWSYWSRLAGLKIYSEKDYFMKVVVKVREDLKLEFSGFEVISNEEVIVYARHNLYKENFKYTFTYESGAWRMNYK